MQDRYVGDVGDFAKYGLLRHLVASHPDIPRQRLAVVWYLVDDEGHNLDGRHIGYLTKPTLRDCDSPLFDALGRIVSAGRRSIAEIEKSEILPPDTVYVSQRLTSASRATWFQQALAATQDVDLVFLDPDNGLETASMSLSAPRASKYVLMEEVRAFFDRRQSLVIYQHLDRSAPAPTQIARTRERLRSAMGTTSSVFAVTFRKGSVRTFYVVCPAPRTDAIRHRLQLIHRTLWHSQLEIAL